MDGKIRSVIKPGIRVSIVLKKDQRTGILTEGIVKEILTNSPRRSNGLFTNITIKTILTRFFGRSRHKILLFNGCNQAICFLVDNL